VTGRDFHLGDVVQYPASRRWVQPVRWAEGTVAGFRFDPRNDRERWLAANTNQGWVEVLGADARTRSFRRTEIRLVRAFDQ